MNALPKISPHAKSYIFTKKNISLYQDNSLEKAQRLKSQMNCNGVLFKRKEQNLMEQINQRKALKSKLLTHNKLKELVEQNIKDYKLKQDIEYDSAVKIQKNVRGYLVRKMYEEDITRIKKISATKCVNLMQSSIYSM